MSPRQTTNKTCFDKQGGDIESVYRMDMQLVELYNMSRRTGN